MTSSFTQLQMWWLTPNPYWINAFMKAPLFPWPHIISGLQSPHSHGKPQHIPPSRTQSDAWKLNFIASCQKRHILKLSRDSEMTFLWQLFLFGEGQHKLPQTAKIPEAFRNWDCVEPAKHPLCCNGHQTGGRKGHLHITHILLCGLVSLVTL